MGTPLQPHRPAVAHTHTYIIHDTCMYRVWFRPYTSLTTVATVAPPMPPFARPRRCLVNAQSTKEIEQILKKVKAYNFPCCYLVELLALGLCWRRGVVVSGVRQ